MKMWKLITAVWLFFSTFAVAHPHAFIEMQTTPLLQQQELIGFQMQWRLDEVSSAEVLYDLKQSEGNSKAQQILADEIMQNVVNEHYFSYFYDEQDQPIKYQSKPRNYGIKAQGNQVLYYFDVLLTKPQTLLNAKYRLLIYDPTYYVSMYYPENMAQNLGKLPENCQARIQQPQVNNQIRQYASRLDRSQRDEDYSLGANFAQTLQIKCK